MITYPTNLDILVNPVSTDTLNNPSHADQHINSNDAIEALEAKVGIDGSAVTASLDYKVTDIDSKLTSHTHTLSAGATDVTASAAELNLLDGKTLSGIDSEVITGTNGSSYDDGIWDGNGDIVGLKSLVGTGDGVTDDTDSLNTFLTANAGKSVKIPAGNYLVTNTIAIPANTTVYAYGARIFDKVTHRTLVTMASGSKLFGMEIEGAASATYDSNGVGIGVVGTLGSEVVYVTIKDCNVHDTGIYGIKNWYANHVDITNCYVHDIGYAGIMNLTCKDVKIDSCHIDTITPGSSLNCYGITFTNYATEGRSEDCSVTNSIVENATIWEGIDTHGGKGIRIQNNIVRGCAVGIVLKMSPSSGTADFAATDCVVDGNVVYGGGSLGLYVNGTTDLYARNNVVSNNVFYDCGGEGVARVTTCAVQIGYTYNSVISNNIVDKPYGSGILVKRGNVGFVVEGNIVTDAQNSIVDGTAGIYVYIDSVGIITNNQLNLVNAALNDYVAEVGIIIGGDAENNVTLGPNQNNYTVPMSIADEQVNYGFLTKPMARGYSSSAQSNLVNTEATQIVLGGESYDVGGNFASSAFTAPIAGKYRINGCVMFAGVIANKLYAVQLRVGATVLKDNYGHSGLASSLSVASEITAQLSAGQVVTLWAISFSGDNTVDIQTGERYTHLEVEFIGD